MSTVSLMTSLLTQYYSRFLPKYVRLFLKCS